MLDFFDASSATELKISRIYRGDVESYRAVPGLFPGLILNLPPSPDQPHLIPLPPPTLNTRTWLFPWCFFKVFPGILLGNSRVVPGWFPGHLGQALSVRAFPAVSFQIASCTLVSFPGVPG